MWRVNWAHPEFGQLLATCSFDRTAIIWEEVGMYGILFRNRAQNPTRFYARAQVSYKPVAGRLDA